MTSKLFLIAWLLCYVYAVLSWPEDLRTCAIALNSSNPSLASLGKSVCRSGEMYATCMGYADTVSIQTDSVSYTHATSTIRVEINPNATVGQDQFYYTFCVSYNSSSAYELVACASNQGEMVELEHRWQSNGLAQMRVAVFDKASYRAPIGCNISEITVAGNFGLKLGVKLFDDQHPFNSTLSKTTFPLLPSSSPAPITNSTKNTYITGNLTFVPQPDLTMGNKSHVHLYHYLYSYDYGDNSTVEEHSEFNTTHLYRHAGNYSYRVDAFAINARQQTRAYHATHHGTVVILEPVSNVSVKFSDNSVIADTKVYLHICANGSFPISVCWVIQPANSTALSKHHPSLSVCSDRYNNHQTCHNISENYPCPSYQMSFSDKGHYELSAEFTNRVSCVRVTYTFHVVAASKPPIVATTTSAGVVVAIVIAVVIVVIILAVGGYLPYRRYRNHMIETADFKFIDLTEKKRSAWGRFKMKLSRVYAQMRSRKTPDKIGLVNLISVSEQTHGNTSTSYSSLSGSCTNNNYNTV